MVDVQLPGFHKLARMIERGQLKKSLIYEMDFAHEFPLVKGGKGDISKIEKVQHGLVII